MAVTSIMNLTHPELKNFRNNVGFTWQFLANLDFNQSAHSPSIFPFSHIVLKEPRNIHICILARSLSARVN